MSVTDGYKAALKVQGRLQPLIEHLVRTPNRTPVVRLVRADYATLTKYPQAASMLGFDCRGAAGVWYRGFELLPIPEGA